MSKGSVFILSGPSGCGKDTILQEVFKKCPNLKFSISSITRAMRENEKEGEKYNFVSKEHFEKMLADNELLEYNVYVGNYYGTPKTPILKATENGNDIVIEVDVNGAAQIRSNLEDTVSIFILPPSIDELRKRLSARGTETEETIEKRISSAYDEIKRSVEYDYIVVNDKLEDAVNDVITIIRSQKFRLVNNKTTIEEVLKKC